MNWQLFSEAVWAFVMGAEITLIIFLAIVIMLDRKEPAL